MARYACVEKGIVTNVIEWDGRAPHAKANLCILDVKGEAQIGGTYDGKKFTSPVVAAPEPIVDPKDAEIAELKLRLAVLEAKLGL